jgi:2-amino-4-hydroxy-6-hydroxymethyldihydropteridine diphosphokinase
MTPPNSSQFFISVGSNVNPKENIKLSIDALASVFGNLTISPWYESVAVGFNGDNFINGVVGAKTNQSIEDVVSLLKNIEDQIGRDRRFGKYSAKIIDLDLLTFDQIICEKPTPLPRDEITENAFVLLPLSDLIPDSIHPLTHKSYRQLWQEYPKSKQALWQIDW